MHTLQKEIIHYPRLDTILRVEDILKKAKDPLSKNEIDRRLEKKIMRPTLNLILGYLEDSGKITHPKEGLLWIFHKDISKRLEQNLKKGVRVL